MDCGVADDRAAFVPGMVTRRTTAARVSDSIRRKKAGGISQRLPGTGAENHPAMHQHDDGIAEFLWKVGPDVVQGEGRGQRYWAGAGSGVDDHHDSVRGSWGYGIVGFPSNVSAASYRSQIAALFATSSFQSRTI